VNHFTNDRSETEALLERIHDGDREAFEALFASHRADLKRMVELRLAPRLRKRVDSSDVVQEAQLEAARRLQDYLQRPTMPFRLWLRQITYDRLLMLHRKHVEAKRRAVTRELSLPENSSLALGRQLVARGASPSAALARSELGGRVRLALAKLSDDDRELLLMRNFEGLSNQEVAQVLDVDPSTASKRYGRALLRLRSLLMAEGSFE
jgi:RNA polymerase sigma-70 factor (ECF subfamily)